MTQREPSNGAPRHITKVYLLAWCTLAIAAVVYIANLSLRDEGVLIGSRAETREASAAGKLSLERVAIELSRTRKNVAKLDQKVTTVEKSVADLRAQTGQMQDQFSSLNKTAQQPFGQVEVLEAVPSDQQTSAAAAQSAKQTVIKTSSTVKNASEDVVASVVGTTIEAGQKPKTVAGVSSRDVSLLLQEATSTTGPLAKIPLPDRRSYGVELAQGPTVESIRLFWDLLRDRHSAILSGLSSRYLPRTDNPTNPYSLIAGPLPNSVSAEQLCTRLLQVGLQCRPTGYLGNAL